MGTRPRSVARNALKSRHEFKPLSTDRKLGPDAERQFANNESNGCPRLPEAVPIPGDVSGAARSIIKNGRQNFTGECLPDKGGAIAVMPVVGADDPWRERLEALTRCRINAVVERNDEFADDLRGCPRSIAKILTSHEGDERHDAKSFEAGITDPRDEFYAVVTPLNIYIKGHR